MSDLKRVHLQTYGNVLSFFYYTWRDVFSIPLSWYWPADSTLRHYVTLIACEHLQKCLSWWEHGLSACAAGSGQGQYHKDHMTIKTVQKMFTTLNGFKRFKTILKKCLHALSAGFEHCV